MEGGGDLNLIFCIFLSAKQANQYTKIAILTSENVGEKDFRRNIFVSCRMVFHLLLIMLAISHEVVGQSWLTKEERLEASKIQMNFRRSI